MSENYGGFIAIGVSIMYRGSKRTLICASNYGLGIEQRPYHV